jgi:hypothetical protein
MTAAKFKPLVFPVTGFALSNMANFPYPLQKKVTKERMLLGTGRGF